MHVTVRGILDDVAIRPDKIWLNRSTMRLTVDGRNFEAKPNVLIDYASFPDFAYGFFKIRDSWYDVPAFWHDLLVRFRKTLGVTLRWCHRVFNALLKLYGTPTGLRRTMFTSVWLVNWSIVGRGRGMMPFKLHTFEIWKVIKEAGQPIPCNAAASASAPC